MLLTTMDDIAVIDKLLDEAWKDQLSNFDRQKEGHNVDAAIAIKKEEIDELRATREQLVERQEPLPSINVNDFTKTYGKSLLRDTNRVGRALYDMSVPGGKGNNTVIHWKDIEEYIEDWSPAKQKHFTQSLIGARLYWYPTAHRGMMQRTLAAASARDYALILDEVSRHDPTMGDFHDEEW